jgi:hypothetical protein
MISILLGFFTTVIFYSYGNIAPQATTNQFSFILSSLGNLPGDPFERLVPFLCACAVIGLDYYKRRTSL